MPNAILVVEPDAALRDTIAHALRGEGYFVLAVADGALAVDVARHNPLALVLLDPMDLQPGGREVCQELRACALTPDVPILMLLTSESEIPQMVRLEPGGNDALMKPLQWGELRVCVQVGSVPGTETTQDDGKVLVADDLRIDIARRHVTRGNRTIDLYQVRLFDLLVYLVRHRGIVLTRDRLLKEVWRDAQVNDSRTVDTHVRWLRQKLEEDPDHPQLIETVRGVGYRFKD
jgi:two-component system alkaline phosphatase synthesis response regulator PhoP